MPSSLGHVAPSTPQLLGAAVASISAALLLSLRWRQKRFGSLEAALSEALRRLDQAHRAPFSKEGEAEYCEAVERWTVHLRTRAGEVPSVALQLGARAQHLERGAIPRKSYPEGREGYLRWRAAAKVRQGRRIEELFGDLKVGLGEACIQRVRDFVAKTLPLRPHHGAQVNQKGDAEMQCIEDAACLVFLEADLRNGFDEGKYDIKMVDILQKTWRKMSRPAHAEALTVDYTPRMLGCVAEAIGQVELQDELARSACPDVPLPVPVPGTATLEILSETWAAKQHSEECLGDVWYRELQQSPSYASDLAHVLNFPVCRAANIDRLVDTLLQILPEEPAEGNLPRFATVLRSAALLAQRHAGLRLRHVDAMRHALVTAMCHLSADGKCQVNKQTQRAWESFGYAIGAQVAPFLLLSDSTHDLCAAIATPLPTPGAGPCAAILAAQGAALIEMAIGVLSRKGKITTDCQSDVAALAVLGVKSRHCAQKDAHVYCGLLAVAIFDSSEGRQVRREKWLLPCTKVPLEVARSAIEAMRIAVRLESSIKDGAPSVVGDLEAGQNMLLTAAEVSLRTAEINIRSSPTLSELLEEVTLLKQDKENLHLLSKSMTLT